MSGPRDSSSFVLLPPDFSFSPFSHSTRLQPDGLGAWSHYTTEGAPVAGGLTEKTQGKKKTTETEARSPLATVYTCTVSSRSIPGKIWMPTNQITAISVRAHVFRELRARAPRHLGVYKESQVAHRLSRVRVS